MSGQLLPQVGDIVAGKYRVERLLGSGGMGSVYQVTHQVTGKAFAIKWLLPDLSQNTDIVKRFIREAQVAGRFEHPNVVEVYDVGQDGGSFYMVMELLHGESLAERLATCKRLSAEEACALLLPCVRGVARAHEAGIVHRDLKPDNIFLCRASEGLPERPKVLDFGISKMSQLQGELVPSITRTGTVMGTPHYMAPEQLRGRETDHRVDVYALGVIFYQVLSGELPFPADTFSELVLQIATEEPEPLARLAPDVPPGMVAIVERAMAREADQRFANLDELIQALEGQSVAPDPLAATQLAATPGRGTVRLKTPLATESRSLTPPAGMRPTSAKSMAWIVGGVGLAVVVVGVWALSLLDRAQQAAEHTETPPAAAGSGTPDTETADPSPETPPQPKTVRIAGPESPSETGRMPAQDSLDAVIEPSKPSTTPGAVRPDADAPVRLAPGFKRPNEAAADRQAAEERRRQAREAARERARRKADRKTQRQKPPKPDEAPAASRPPPGEAAREATERPAGRLQIELGVDEF